MRLHSWVSIREQYGNKAAGSSEAISKADSSSPPQDPKNPTVAAVSNINLGSLAPLSTPMDITVYTTLWYNCIIPSITPPLARPPARFPAARLQEVMKKLEIYNFANCGHVMHQRSGLPYIENISNQADNVSHRGGARRKGDEIVRSIRTLGVVSCSITDAK